MSKHDINSMGDFLNCKNKDCIWSATWSLGHICDYCKLNHCICPCPLTKEWLKLNRWEIIGRRFEQLIDHDLASEFFMISQEEENKDNKDSVWYGRSNKHNWQRRGQLEQIQRFIDHTGVKDQIKSGYLCPKCQFLKPICRCKK